MAYTIGNKINAYTQQGKPVPGIVIATEGDYTVVKLDIDRDTTRILTEALTPR